MHHDDLTTSGDAHNPRCVFPWSSTYGWRFMECHDSADPGVELLLAGTFASGGLNIAPVDFWPVVVTGDCRGPLHAFQAPTCPIARIAGEAGGDNHDSRIQRWPARESTVTITGYRWIDAYDDEGAPKGWRLRVITDDQRRVYRSSPSAQENAPKSGPESLDSDILSANDSQSFDCEAAGL